MHAAGHAVDDVRPDDHDATPRARATVPNSCPTFVVYKANWHGHHGAARGVLEILQIPYSFIYLYTRVQRSLSVRTPRIQQKKIRNSDTMMIDMASYSIQT